MCFHSPDAAEAATVRWDACPGPAKNEKMRNICERFGRWHSVVGAAGIRMQEFGSLFQEHSLESARAKLQDGPKSLILSAFGAGGQRDWPGGNPAAPSVVPVPPAPGSGLLGTEGSGPPYRGAGARWVSHPVLATAAAPGVAPPGSPAPGAAAEPRSPAPPSPAPTGAELGGGERHTASWAGFWGVFIPTFSSSAPRALPTGELGL